ncbi:hypothetical protein C8A05DRAFT_13212 [Staphylotrichum tortipilum]|uniref:Uncharacterized protein n=1 Tax=Staphylotrichum tortipilum TaxID=2831512 RepID=A0AAN6RW37_9PEZI|nr:hypothetical protein C8A05DRAFT_13212 [Staphylotrichum longicolle]
MPYSDNLYSALDDDSDIESIAESTNQLEHRGLGVTPGTAWWNAAVAGSGDGDGPDDNESAHPGDAVDVEDPHLLSPTDGYFGTATRTSAAPVRPTSSNVPHVPNVMVEDPSLQRSAAEGKAREAEQERTRDAQTPSDEDPGEDDGASDPPPSRVVASPSQVHPHPPSTHQPMTPPQQRSTTTTASSSPFPGAASYTPSSPARSPPAATPSSYTTYSTRRPAYHGDRFPFLPREAPPAYTPSPTTTASPTSPRGFPDISRTTYSTFPHTAYSSTSDVAVNMGRPEETRALLGHYQPESMRDRGSGGHGDGAPPPPTWGDRLRRARGHVNAGNAKLAVIAVLLLLVTSGFVSSLVTGTRGRPGPHKPIHPPVGDTPLPEPGQPNMSYPEIDGDFTWAEALYCKDAQIHRNTQTYAFDFGDSKSLRIEERTTRDDDHRGGGEVHVQGAVVFRRAGPDTPSSAITLEVTVTDERLTLYSSWDADAGALEIIVPHRVDWSADRPRACANIKLTVWVPAGGALKRLSVEAVHLDIKLLDNLSLTVADGSKLDSTVGTITAASTGTTPRDEALIDTGAPPAFRFHSRIIDVRTTAAPIRGAWPLYDYLGLQSTAGSIKVAVKPEPADKELPKPATLYVKSLSGDVDVREPIHAAEAAFRIAHANKGAAAAPAMLLPPTEPPVTTAEEILPPRDYRVDVHTTSGDITGALAFSSAAGFKSTSGTVSLDLLPVLPIALAEPDPRPVELTTTSTSGATDATVLSPLWISTDEATYLPSSQEEEGEIPLRCLHTTHSTTSAGVRVRLPASWEGDVSLASLTGLLQVGGDGVRLIKAGSEWPGINKSLVARKGEKGVGGRTVGKSTSGDVDVWVGRK